MANLQQTPERSRAIGYYIPTLNNVNEPLRILLEDYSGIPADRIEKHIWEVRERAWEVHPYPCIGQWRFADLRLSLHPAYPKVLERLQKQGQSFLDMGCCFGQDIRKLIYDGVLPTKDIHALDLRPEYIELGFDLFQDRAKLYDAVDFFTADVFDNTSDDLQRICGQVDVIWASSFFHLFDWDQQVALGKRVVEILRPQRGSLILGRQRGTSQPGSYPSTSNRSGQVFRHDVATWEKLWKEIGDITSTKWQIHAHLAFRDDSTDVSPNDAKNRRRLIFTVQRM